MYCIIFINMHSMIYCMIVATRLSDMIPDDWTVSWVKWHTLFSINNHGDKGHLQNNNNACTTSNRIMKLHNTINTINVINWFNVIAFNKKKPWITIRMQKCKMQIKSINTYNLQINTINIIHDTKMLRNLHWFFFHKYIYHKWIYVTQYTH